MRIAKIEELLWGQQSGNDEDGDGGGNGGGDNDDGDDDSGMSLRFQVAG